MDKSEKLHLSGCLTWVRSNFQRGLHLTSPLICQTFSFLLFPHSDICMKLLNISLLKDSNHYIPSSVTKTIYLHLSSRSEVISLDVF